MRFVPIITVGLLVIACTTLTNGAIPSDEASAAKMENSNVRSSQANIKVETTKSAANKPSTTPQAAKPVKHEKLEETTVGKSDLKPADPNAVSASFTAPARILVVMPAPGYSHTINCMPIFKELARRGHHITMVSPFPQKEPLLNWEDITVENTMEKLLNMMSDKDLTKMTGFISNLIGITFFGPAMMNLIFDMKPLQDLMADNSRKYDLVFVEATFVQEPLLAFGHKFGVPVVSISPSTMTPELAYYTGNPVLTSTYFPSMAFSYTNRMSFIERAKNTAHTILKIMIYNLVYLPKMDAMMRERWPATKEMPPLSDMLFNVSLTLLDGNPSLNYPYPKHRNVIEFLGVNTKDTSLTPELQTILDSADEHGVLFFTLGSHFKTSTLRPEIISSLVDAFSKIPQKVLMKWDADAPPHNLPPNVYTAKWFPQAAILRHANVRAFLTHTGIHGLMEAMHHGVPVISIPLFADQHYFAKWAEEAGAGKPIYIDTITPESALLTITEVINNPKFKEAAKTVSRLLDDLPIPTLSEVVFWVEHVLRTKGARHLRPGSLNLWWYERFGLDLLAATVAVLVICVWALKIVFRCLLCRRKPKNVEKSKETSKRKSMKQE